MDEPLPQAAIPRPLDRKIRAHRDPGDILKSLSGFFIVLGFLVLGTGIICFMGFHNQLSKFMLDVGILLCIVGFIVKILDVFVKIVTGFRK